MPDEDNSSNAPQKGSNFWDSTFALILLVAAILFARFYIAEPFKIPSGSMEPTLFGHEDYGDRIVTNKLAYESFWHCAGMGAIALALIAVGFFASHAYRRLRTLIVGVLIFAGTIAGFTFAFVDHAIAGEPQRFDVVVFRYNTYWSRSKREAADEAEAEARHTTFQSQTKSQEINYIKRLVGLPGDRIMVAGGDLWLYDKKEGRYKIVRKWDTRGDALQDELWYPVAKAWTGNVYKNVPEDERDAIAVPWRGAEKDAPGVVRNSKSLTLTGDANVTLEYAYPVQNVYIKQGRWPLKHIGCPAAKDNGQTAPSGAVFRNPDTKTEEMSSYIFHTWEGVQCPNCKQVMFPATITPQEGPHIYANSTNPRFFYGGDHTVGDLRIDLELDVEKAGGMTLEAGSDLHRAVWTLGDQPAAADSSGAHAIDLKAALTPGHHSISLAYVDATVIARIDGQEQRRLIDLPLPGREADAMNSLAKISFSGVKGTITRLDLFRDLHYTAMIMSDDRSLNAVAGQNRQISGNQSMHGEREVDEEGRYTCTIPEGYYLMMGDNSPSSSDGRVWGFVPRDNLVGRASFIAWPLSRARLIK